MNQRALILASILFRLRKLGALIRRSSLVYLGQRELVVLATEHVHALFVYLFDASTCKVVAKFVLYQSEGVSFL